ncbi:MAG: hypothetical protein QM741_04140 [Rudaea sp.]|uniref:hypothetical protein n=1 Tax=Rudaea sp. TaxID=2136325 RepID=UPI0039E61FF0
MRLARHRTRKRRAPRPARPRRPVRGDRRMNLVIVWKTGGATLDWGQRRFIAASWALMTLLALLWLMKPNTGIAVMTTYAFGMVFWWCFVGVRAVLLQRDLRLLKVPETDRAIFASLALQYLLSAILPVLALAWIAHVDFVRTSAFFTLCVTGALLFQLLPRVLGVIFGFLPMFMQYLDASGKIPGFNDPAFAVVGWGMACAFAAVAAWRWHVLLNARPDSFGDWSMPMVPRMRGQVGMGAGWKNFDSNLFFAAGNDAMASRINIDRAGPATPITALRVWLGGVFAPTSAPMRLAYAALALLPGVLVIAIVATLWPAMIAAIACARLYRLFNGASGEIALLAVLPGLGVRKAKRNLLTASFGPALVALTLLYAVFVGLALAHFVSTALFASISLAFLGTAALGMTLGLSIAGGRELPAFGVGVLCIAALMLASMTPAFLQSGEHGFRFTIAARCVLGAWLSLFALCAWLGLRGWRAYRRRPHPFLLNS